MKKILLILLSLLSITSVDGQILKLSGSGSFTIANTSEASRACYIRIWGAGGGGSASGTRSGAGGGGGGYVRIDNIILPAGTYQFSVGSGGSSGVNGENTTLTFPDGTLVTVYGGRSASGQNGGLGSISATENTPFSFAVSTNGTGGQGSSGASANAGQGGSSTAFSSGVYPSSPVSVSSTPGAGGVSGSPIGKNGAGAGAGGGGGSNAVSSSLGGNGSNGRIQIDFASGNAPILPVTFGAIKAAEKGTGVQIDWTSYSELNIANYQIERSADGINFTSVGEVAPRNVVDASNYSFFDALPLSGTNFYRIRNNDIDGKSGLSNIVKINLNKNIKTISVYPNPIRGNRVSFQTSDLTKGTYNVEVINAMGARVYQQSVNHAGGAINQSLSLPTLQSGSYTLRINGTATASTHKITILQ